MNRKVLAAIAAALLVLAASGSFAASGWKLAGDWDYTLSIPSATVNGYPSSLVENGSMTMHMTTSGDQEYFSTFDQSWQGTLTVNGSAQTYSGSVAGRTLNPSLYVPGEAYGTTSTQVISGTTVTAKYTLTQVEADKVTGTATVAYGSETATGTITAARKASDDSGSGGGCSAGFAAAALLALAPLALTRKRQR